MTGSKKVDEPWNSLWIAPRFFDDFFPKFEARRSIWASLILAKNSSETLRLRLLGIPSVFKAIHW
jgi:hypothetical protein